MNNGFVHIEEISKLFNRKNNYNTFDEFFKNEIVKYMIELNNNIK